MFLNLCMLSHPCIPWINPTWLKFLMIRLILFAIFLKIISPMCIIILCILFWPVGFCFNVSGAFRPRAIVINMLQTLRMALNF